MKRIVKWLIPCLVACFMVVGLVQTASYTFATTEEGQTEIVGSSDDLNAGNSNEGSDTDVEGNPEESSEDEPEVDENTSEENLEESEIGPEGTVSNARIISLYDSDQNDLSAPTHSKTVKKIEGTNDEYYLSLDVTGRKEIEPGKLPQVDIVLVVDASGSMDEKINSYEEITYGQLTRENCYAEYTNGKKYRIYYHEGDWWDSESYFYFNPGWSSIKIDENTGFKLFKLNRVTKMTALNNAVTSVNGLSSSILNNNNIDAQMAVVLFNRTAEQKCDWTDSVDAINAVIPKGDAGDEGTNYYDGLNKAEEYLLEARPKSQKYIIFLSDGEPTYYMNGNTVKGTGYDDSVNVNTCANQAYTKANSLSQSNIAGFTGFYTVGFGIDTNNNAKNILTNLSNKPDCTKHGSFLANDTSSLINVFEGIVAEITENYFSNIKIEDVLSDNVDLTSEMVVGDKGQLTGYEFKVTDSKGKNVENPDVTPTVKYTSSDKKISIQFPVAYQLKEGYTYTFIFKIRPNDNAYETFAENKGKYPEEAKMENNLEIGGDLNKGFYSNTIATLSYKFKEQDKTVEYDKDQFVKVHPTSLTVNKEWKKSDNTDMKEGLPESIEVELLKDGKDTNKKVILNAENKWSDSFEYLNPNYSYTVKELSIPGYKVSYSDITNNSITITNRKLPTLTIEKNVTGLFGNKKQTFKVSITLKDADGNALSGTYGKVTFDQDGNAVEEISVDDPIELTDLPFGTKYTVEEDDYSSDGYTTSYKIDGEKTEDGCSGQLEKENKDGDDVVVITNTKDAVPLTGLTDNTPKGLGLIGSIVVEIAAIAFVLKKKRQLKM